jgi:hypothetical protein
MTRALPVLAFALAAAYVASQFGATVAAMGLHP